MPSDTIFKQAVANIHKNADRVRFSGNIGQVGLAGDAFAVAAESGTIEVLTPASFVLPDVTIEEMQRVYSYRLRRASAPARHHYDRIKAAPRHSQCPYCGERTVKTLDHYLPQSVFSALAVTPTNLVPSCSDCNKSKSDYRPSATDPALLHPYFDNTDAITWLRATVIPGDPPGVEYWVDVTVLKSVAFSLRLQKHFEVFELNELFISKAGQTLEDLETRVPGIFSNGGPSAVQEFLVAEAGHLSSRRHNTWERALYMGLAGNTWYCDTYCQVQLAAQAANLLV